MQFTFRDIGYTVCSRLEEALRGWVAIRISSSSANWAPLVPKGVIDKVLDRAQKASTSAFDDVVDALQETDIPDLQEIILKKGSPILDGIVLPISKDGLRELLELAYRLRCKIAHARGSFSSLDLQALMSAADELSTVVGRSADDLVALLTALRSDDVSQVMTVPRSFLVYDSPSCSPIPTNLPQMDYDVDGGYVGRKEDLQRVRDLLLGGIHRVVTITGAGGVGKTALAHRFCASLLEKKTQPFDAIVWVSAKEERLTLTGIEPIEPDIQNYEELLDRILTVYGWNDPDSMTTKAKEEDVALILGATEKGTLLVVDNLETVRDERILESIKDMPAPNKVLITSRLGLGEVERRHPLRELNDEDAVTLMRLLARQKGLNDFARLPDSILLKNAKRMAKYPLAIKWVLGQLALGKSLDQLTEQLTAAEGDVARFCFDAVYAQLDDDSRLVLSCLAASDTPLTRGTLLHVTDLDNTRLDQAVNHLTVASLVLPEFTSTETQEIVTRFLLLPLTRGYLKGKLASSPDLLRGINQRLQKVSDQVEEANRATRHYRYAMQDLGATTEDERIAAAQALTAYQLYQSGDYESAAVSFKRAVDIAPRLPRLYRNWAFVESSAGYYDKAEELMQRATSLAPQDAVLWFAWGNIEKKRGRLDKAKLHFTRARRLSPGDGAVTGALAETEKRLGNYAEADRLYREALSATTGAGYRHELISLTAMADNLRRWGEQFSRDHNYPAASAKIEEAYATATRAARIDPQDEKAIQTFRECALEKARNVARDHDIDSALPFFDEAMIDRPISAQQKRRASKVCHAKALELLRAGRIEAAQQAYRLGDRIRLHHPEDNERYETLRKALQSRRVGTVTRVIEDKGYAFIECEGSSVFAHVSVTVPRLTNEEFKALEGTKVTFQVISTEKGPQAIDIARLMP